MPLSSQAQVRRSVTLAEWVTPTGVVLAVGGDLDAMGCRVVEQALRRLLARWPGLYLTLDLDGVKAIDQDAVEALVLTLVALRAGEARLGIEARGGQCRHVIARMGVEPATPVRWPGVTA
jgi:anti-anti-sigma regulatory factor